MKELEVRPMSQEIIKGYEGQLEKALETIRQNEQNVRMDVQSHILDVINTIFIEHDIDIKDQEEITKWRLSEDRTKLIREEKPIEEKPAKKRKNGQ